MQNIQNQKTKVIIVIGAPGTGKGTQCKIITRHTGMIHISTGDLCREAIRLNTETGKKIEEYFRRGDLISDEIMIEVIEERLRNTDAIAHGVLLDGYPRTVKQAEALTKSNIEVNRVILMQASDNVCKKRIIGRRIDPITGDSYNKNYVGHKCQNQQVLQRLVQRDNDKDISIIKVRLKYYHMNLGQILKYFQGKIFAVDAAKNVNTVTAAMKIALNEQIVPEQIILTQPAQIQAQKSQKCAICYDEDADFLTIPCCHLCGCENCLSQILGQPARNRKCPICRRNMTGITQVFKSGVDEEDSEELIVEEVELGFSDIGEIGEQNGDGGEQNDDGFDGGGEQNDDGFDGGWGAAEALANQTTAVDSFERNISNCLKVTVAPCDDIDNNGKNDINIAITIQVPDIPEQNEQGLTNRAPVDICCVIDVSGSMNEPAKFQDPDDPTKTINEGISILDLVKHSVKTVMHTLTDQDRFSLVTFNNTAKTVVTLREMNNNGRKQAIKILENLRGDGGTNIWGGLEAGLNVLHTADGFATGTSIPRKKNIFLLTDGQPNVHPPKGEGYAFKQYLESCPVKCQVHTFGFGYILESGLLLDLATLGNGSYGFIPDAKIVGTCFVDAIANACSTFSQNCNVHLVPKGSATFAHCEEGKQIGGLILYERTSSQKPDLVVRLGPLQYGQSRDIIVRMNIPSSGLPERDAVIASRLRSGKAFQKRIKVDNNSNNSNNSNSKYSFLT